MATSTLIFRSLAILALLGPAAVAAPPKPSPTRPWTGYKRITAQPRDTSTANLSSRLVYMNRCLGTCEVRPGNEDSRTMTSSIPDTIKIIPEFTQGDQVWSEMMQCVRETFAPFNIQITDVNPGPTVPHFMNIVGGRGTDLSSDLTNAGGVAPFTCAEIPNAISFTFDVYGPDPLQLCWTAAQEVAHAFGLDHEFLQKDPMTYLGGDLPKRFRDADSICGRNEEEPCACGRTKQNSYRMIVNLFGPGAPSPPEVTLRYPTTGKKTQPGFSVLAKALDDVRVEKVELYIDGVLATTVMTSIGDVFDLETSRELAQGPHELEVKAIDVQGTPASVTASFEVGPPCTPDSICSGDDVCVEGVCIPGPDTPGGLGTQCTADTECLSHRCLDGGETYKYCVEECTVGNAASCPNEFECLAAGAGGVCWPNPGGGCCETGTGPQGPMLLGLGVALLVLRRRRRS